MNPFPFLSHTLHPQAAGPVRLPPGYRGGTGWMPRIGDIFPDFEAQTTQGLIRFHAWAEGRWTVLFSQPGAFTPVCTTELGSLAEAIPELDRRGAQAIGLTPDPVADLAAWCADVAALFGSAVGFPMISDPGGAIAGACGMTHLKESPDVPIRMTLILDPALHVRMIFEYPLRIGRGTEEILRVLDALQEGDRLDVATPADWQPGDLLLVPSAFSDEEADARFGAGGWRPLRRYLRVLAPPATAHRAAGAAATRLPRAR
ncbi:redoxin domain-containing protein [Rhodovulum tesquicola]|uniref:redoxin domain-containing protein n=1 Tax=Rhodovulum tesquicola TaxID=540254 RepID=UPI002097B394|nr:redoxin domain-containing protein [Rhodovulum tesquicola]MCO8146135.1 redoxin domain-containing protein [Rhodovulum tesquicola]